ncbi:hypothetical protein HMPREF9397_0537 [Streptococcus sanguinis SK1087]|jgi:hypothetical protein|uniref:Uncharacterized protein n=3 Tax=Streptococcus sanguinis TaxID=1305 RepID=F0IV99_STRSA|nr:hypothetical protein HMPREF9390_0506 [Streptococcus sanguinis SK405]EGD37764.1 hypothetical protein HMPREF9384_1761 [Streptococcus sanguinis SK160]EGF06571.1 hypothetical protein HMPREF9394_1185 [Streptococcus sanguinis SK1057]EGG40498.1 hypothetical protein HMPREF9397_0537 [Streptococcus sanguinis SK1087]
MLYYEENHVSFEIDFWYLKEDLKTGYSSSLPMEGIKLMIF